MVDNTGPGWTMVDNGLVEGLSLADVRPDRWLCMRNQRELFGNLQVSCNKVSCGRGMCL